jgi:hypothetical protein
MPSANGSSQSDPSARGSGSSGSGRPEGDRLAWRTLISIAEINPKTAGFALIGFLLFWVGYQFEYKDYLFFWIIVGIVFLPVIIASLKYAWAILFFGEDNKPRSK